MSTVEIDPRITEAVKMGVTEAQVLLTFEKTIPTSLRTVAIEGLTLHEEHVFATVSATLRMESLDEVLEIPGLASIEMDVQMRTQGEED